MKTETDGNQAATQSSGNNRGSEAQKTNTLVVEDRPPLSVEQAIDAVRISATNLRDVTMAQLVSAMADFDSKLYQLIAAVRADEDEKWRQRMETLNAVLPGKAECAESAPVDQQEIERQKAELDSAMSLVRAATREGVIAVAIARAEAAEAETERLRALLNEVPTVARFAYGECGRGCEAEYIIKAVEKVAELARLRAPFDEQLEEKNDDARLAPSSAPRHESDQRADQPSGSVEFNYGDRVTVNGRPGVYEGLHPIHDGALVRFKDDYGQSLVSSELLMPLPSPPEAQK